MKAVSLLTLLVSVFLIQTARASHPEHSEKSAADLDKEIFKYQIDALLCAAAPIVSKIPGSTHALEAAKCALVAGLGATEIIRSLTECAHMRHTQSDRDLLGCLKSGSSYFATNKEALACLLHSSLEKPVKHVLHNLGIVGDIVTCSLTVAQGTTLLYETTKAANAARAEARTSASNLAETIASLRGSRLYNMGFYRGCSNITKVYPDDESKCISLCAHQKDDGMGELGGRLNTKQQASAYEACKAGCKASEAVPNSWIYTMLVSSEPSYTRKGCELVVSKVKTTLEGSAQTSFRVLPLPGVDEGTPQERLGAFLSWKLRITSALEAVERKWDTLRQRDGRARTADVVALSDGNDDDAKLISSVFSNRDLGTYTSSAARVEYPILAAYLDSTQTATVDGWISYSDLEAFKEEVSRYNFGQ